MDANFIGPLNLGTNIELTIKQLAEKIIKFTNSSSRLVWQQLPVDDPIRRQPDLSLAQSKINWAPRVSMEDGLITTINYFSDYLITNKG